jgi:adenylate cyclase
VTDEGPALEPALVIRAITELMLGEAPHLKRADVAKLSGVDPDIARQRWRALGFPEADDDDVAFTAADVEALRLTQELIELGIIEPDTEQAFIRTIGRSFSRLADWQVRAFLGAMVSGSQDALASGDIAVLAKIVPLGEKVQDYVWRRHLVNATTRLLLTDADVDSATMCVGFADIVGYTRQSRQMERHELTEMVERFEQVTAGLVTDHHGRVVKTMGDEVMFVLDDAREAAHLALALLDEHEADEAFPELHIGLAYGSVQNHMGDVFGPVVNVASRLTSVARSGTALIDRAMADALGDDEDLRIRPVRRTSVKGYEHLQPWSLKRQRDSSDD